MIELEDRILDRALAGERERVPTAEVEARYEVPREVLDRLAEVGVLSPDDDGYSPSDVRDHRGDQPFPGRAATTRASASPSTTPCATSAALEPLVAEEVEVLTERLAGDVDPERAMEIIEAGIGPLNELIAALHTKLLVARLERHRGRR